MAAEVLVKQVLRAISFFMMKNTISGAHGVDDDDGGVAVDVADLEDDGGGVGADHHGEAVPEVPHAQRVAVGVEDLLQMRAGGGVSLGAFADGLRIRG